jgi:hypothetical protein
LHDWPPKPANSSNRITCQPSLDKLCDGFHNLSSVIEQVMDYDLAILGATGWR